MIFQILGFSLWLFSVNYLIACILKHKAAFYGKLHIFILWTNEVIAESSREAKTVQMHKCSFAQNVIECETPFTVPRTDDGKYKITSIGRVAITVYDSSSIWVFVLLRKCRSTNSLKTSGINEIV